MSPEEKELSEIFIFESDDHTVQVHLEAETVWLSQSQMGDLFGKDVRTINEHVGNVFSEGELERGPTIRKFRIVQQEGNRQVRREIEHYNLDVIISIGYRVKSLEGTRFRQWATRILKEHLAKGYTLDGRKLAKKGIREAQEAVALMAQTLKKNAHVTEEGSEILSVVHRYLNSFHLLLAYDEDRLPDKPTAPRSAKALTIEEALSSIQTLRAELHAENEATELFGRERGHGLSGILGAIEQTMFGQPLYQSAQSRAANLLYFIIKDHPFTDGNKRIGAFLFLEYLRRNNLLLQNNEQPRFTPNAIVALALLIAESAPAQKDLMVRLVLSFLEDV